MPTRGFLTALVAAAAALLMVVAASAQRSATPTERTAIDKVMHVPARCSTVHVSTVNHAYARFAFKPNEGCLRYAANGVVIVHRSDGHWRSIFQASDVSCPIPHVPDAVRKDLRVACDIGG